MHKYSNNLMCFVDMKKYTAIEPNTKYYRLIYTVQTNIFAITQCGFCTVHILASLDQFRAVFQQCYLLLLLLL